MIFTSMDRTSNRHLTSSLQNYPEFWDVLGEAEGGSPREGISHRGEVYLNG
jgi:hypothetical protein